jgi:hypothetical protein
MRAFSFPSWTAFALVGIVATCVGGDLISCPKREVNTTGECVVCPSCLLKSVFVFDPSVDEYSKSTSLQLSGFFCSEKIVVKYVACVAPRSKRSQTELFPASIEGGQNGALSEYSARDNRQLIGWRLSCVANIHNDIRPLIKFGDIRSSSDRYICAKLINDRCGGVLGGVSGLLGGVSSSLTYSYSAPQEESLDNNSEKSETSNNDRQEAEEHRIPVIRRLVVALLAGFFALYLSVWGLNFHH